MIYDILGFVWFYLLLLAFACVESPMVSRFLLMFFDVSWWCLFSFAGEIPSYIIKLVLTSATYLCWIHNGISSAGACHVSHNFKISSMIVHTCDWVVFLNRKIPSRIRGQLCRVLGISAEGGPDTIEDYDVQILIHDGILRVGGMGGAPWTLFWLDLLRSFLFGRSS